MSVRFLVGDVFDRLSELETDSVDLVVTSPPFLALRSYLPADHPDKAKEIGSEATPAEFLDTMLTVAAELRRVLAGHGSMCIEIGDTYAGSGGAGGDWIEGSGQRVYTRGSEIPDFSTMPERKGQGWPLAKSKTLIPQLLEIALAYGYNPLTGQESPAGQWRIRNVVTWARPNPPVGALGDKWRPATSDVIVACTSGKRYWDDLATRQPSKQPKEVARPRHDRSTEGREEFWDAGNGRFGMHPAGAPLLDYWEIPPGGYKGAHYAVYPQELVAPLIKAMCPQKVCRTCGEPSRRVMEHPGIDRRPGAPDATELGAYLKANLNGYSIEALAETLDLPETQVSHYFRTDSAGARLPDPGTWSTLKDLLALDDTYDDAMAIVTAEHENIDYGNREIPERLSGGSDHPKVIPTGDWTDCGHDNYRPGLVLDPFAGSGTTLAVAHGHGHDAIGIDLDERNAELALDRVGPFFLEVVA